MRIHLSLATGLMFSGRINDECLMKWMIARAVGEEEIPTDKFILLFSGVSVE